ncbi:CAP domain-containing protein [Streptomyces sp. CBMA152]|uniref:CAP domain-containing protein n=1 Tax=Streptomyces sp. CBMA152 TaxID=1896312 RepID=UPI0016611411|nr:CAP domain-containing protein [Streptomyces sp. CBMA152]MBD0744440.1 SCP-like extracellular [Streptomyces sp. CBMA152]
MGRHRRSAPAPAAEDHAQGTGSTPQGAARRKKRPVVPVRTGLLGASAAVAVGAVAIASGLLPGGSTFALNGGSSADKHVQADGTSDLRQQGGEAVKPTSAAPSATPATTSPSTHAPLTSPSASAPSKTPSASATPSEQKSTAPVAPKTEAPLTHAPKVTVLPEQRQAKAPTAEAAAAATVVSLVNQQRAQAGCSPLKADGSLAALATAFSDDMAARGFFDHTDPDGKSPWDRAAKAGIGNLGGENIARGQADAKAVMEAWMNSPGHRANILNCDYKTLGVGVHFGEGGPWWTQDFGF